MTNQSPPISETPETPGTSLLKGWKALRSELIGFGIFCAATPVLAGTSIYAFASGYTKTAVVTGLSSLVSGDGIKSGYQKIKKAFSNPTP